jgi:hypothetical protein
MDLGDRTHDVKINNETIGFITEWTLDKPPFFIGSEGPRRSLRFTNFEACRAWVVGSHVNALAVEYCAYER